MFGPYPRAARPGVVALARRLVAAGAIAGLSGVIATCGGDPGTGPPPPTAIQLGFKTVPGSTTVAGEAIAPALVIEGRDATGSLVTNFNGMVTVSLDSNPANGTLTGTMSQPAVNGAATFSDLKVNRSGTGYRLVARATGLVSATSPTFSITAGPASQLAITGQPTNTTGGVPTGAVVVSARDAQGNAATGFTGDVTVAITAGTGTAGAILSGTLTVAAVAGQATFSALSIDKVGTGYTLSASAAGLTAATTAAFDVAVGPAAALEFRVSPGTTVAGAAITPAVLVAAVDAGGNTATGFTGPVTVALGANPAGGTLSGTLTANAAAGVATFSDLWIERSGAGYTLTASSGGVAGATSAPFAVTAGPAAELVFTGQPASGTAGTPITPPVAITARDALGNVADGFTGDVTMSIAAGTGTPAASLSGTTTVAALAGIATFTTLAIDSTGSGYVLSASAGVLPPVTSVAFDIAPGPAAQLVIAAQPGNTTGGVTIAPAVVVLARDQVGNLATGFAGDVTLSITPGTGTAGAVLSGTSTVAAVAGVATFATLSVDKAGTAYTLSASAGAGIAGATSDPFDVAVGPGIKLGFIVAPGTTTAGTTITPPVEVAAQDAGGNTVASFTGQVTVAIGANPGGGSLTGTTIATAVSGVAVFSTLSINKSGVGYTLTATTGGGGLAAATSPPFTIVGGPASALLFTVQPGTTAGGTTITPALEVTARDALGNTADAFTGDVAVAITAGTGTAGAVLSGANTVAAVAGVAVFATLSIDKVGTGYTLSATTSGVAGATSAAFAIIPGVPTQVVFTVQPADATAGFSISPPVEVRVQDAVGNTVTSFNGLVTVAIAGNPGAGTLSGTKTVNAGAGVATFSTLSINKSGTGYTLAATSGSMAPDTSAAFNIAAGAATQLGFIVQPVTTVAGTTITPAVQVAAQDPFGNTDPGFSGDITVAIGVNPASGTLSGTTTVSTVGGVAGFADLAIDRSAPGYTLTAATSGLSGTSSTAFTIAAGMATELIITVQPTTTVAAGAINPPVQVTARDVLGNTATGFVGTVTIAITAGSGTPGAILSGTSAVAASAGVASFPGLRIDKAGTGYTLTATAAAVAEATTNPFNITIGAATHLTFTLPPGTTTAGATITPAIQVSAQDAGGNTVPGYSANVTVAIGTNAGGGTLSGTKVVAASAGVATFSTLSINKSGVGYTLVATAPGVSGATSPTFDIVAGPAARLVFSGQPSITTAGAPISPPVQVTAVDALGNRAPDFTGDVTVAIGTNPAGGTLSGSLTANAVAGVAVFANLSLDRAANGYTLVATTTTGLTPATSAFFNVLAGTASRLAFTVQPSNATAGVALAPSVKVSAQDAYGNTVSTFTGSVTVAITPGTGSAGATLSGATTVGAVAGVATFSALSINKSGNGYGLSASGSGLAASASTTFDISPGPASLLVVTSQPTNATAGATITPPVQVTATDGLGNTVPSFTDQITVAIGTNPGNGTLSGTTSVAAVAGVATFSSLSINRSGSGYTLVAASGALSDGVSAAFDIRAGAPAQLIFTTQPTTTAAGVTITPPVQVTARDAQGNIVATFTDDVTVGIAVNPPGTGTLSGTLTAAAVAGVATFADLSIDKVGTGYRLSASSANVPAPGTSSAFSILVGTVAKLVFTVQPGNTVAGATMTPAVKVSGQDASGNNVPTFTGDVTLAITPGTGSPGATLSGITTIGAVSGVATFSSLSIEKSGTGYTLTATASGLTDGVSASFTIDPGVPIALSFTTQPGTTAAGQSMNPAVQVTAQDLLGNATPGFGGSVTLALQSNPAGGTLFGTTTVTAVAGVATFPNLSIDRSGAGYTLVASSSGLAGGTSAAFTVTPGATTKLVFTAQPSATPALATISPAVQVTAQDDLGNTATGFSGTVSVTIGSNPGTGTLLGTTSTAAVDGIATFPDLSVNQAGNGYTLAASAPGLASGTSVSFDITTGATLVFTTQPVTTTAGATISPAVQVTARDGNGNTMTSFTGGVTVAIAPGMGAPGAALSGTTTVLAVAGVATFTDLSINKSGTGYRLAASGTGFTPGTSSSFAINTGPATQLGFVAQPSTTPAGATIIPGVQVALQDALGNTVKGISGTVTIAIGSNPSGGIVSGTTTAPFSSGVASFFNLSIDQAAAGYTLIATSPGYSDAISASFTITPVSSTRLVFTQAPGPTTAGDPITPSVVVQVWDGAGNVVTAFSGTVTVSITTGTGTNGATLSGATTVQAVNGVATFPDLSIDKAGTGYRLSASASGVAGVNSGTFQIVAGAATQLMFSTQPSNTAANQIITPPVEVTARDSLGNVDRSFTGTVTVAIAVNPGTGTLSGTRTVTAVQGVATFSDLRINQAGTGYRLSASATGLPVVTSSAFTIQ